MRVLLIHQHFGCPDTGGAVRSFYLSKFLIDAGYHVEVISRRNGLKEVQKETVEGIKVHYLPVDYSNDMGFLRRIPAYLRFVYKSIKYLRSLDPSSYDLAYCISTPLTSGIVGLWLKFKYKLPFVFEVGDLWPDAPIQIKAIWFPPTKYTLRLLERYIYAKANGVVGLSPPIVEAIKKRTSTPVKFIPNFSDTAFFTCAFAENSQIVISYVGTLGRANELEYLLDIAKESSAAQLPVRFIIMGDGARKKALIDKASEMNLSNVRFVPFGNKHRVCEVLNASDAVYVSYKKIPVLETGSPNKFFDGLAAGKMIILNFGGWLGDLIQKNECGFNYDPEKPEAFVKKILPYIKNRQKIREAQKNARILADEKYDLHHWKKPFINFLEDSIHSKM